VSRKARASCREQGECENGLLLNTPTGRFHRALARTPLRAGHSAGRKSPRSCVLWAMQKIYLGGAPEAGWKAARPRPTPAEEIAAVLKNRAYLTSPFAAASLRRGATRFLLRSGRTTGITSQGWISISAPCPIGPAGHFLPV